MKRMQSNCINQSNAQQQISNIHYSWYSIFIRISTTYSNYSLVFLIFMSRVKAGGEETAIARVELCQKFLWMNLKCIDFYPICTPRRCVRRKSNIRKFHVWIQPTLGWLFVLFCSRSVSLRILRLLWPLPMRTRVQYEYWRDGESIKNYYFTQNANRDFNPFRILMDLSSAK